MSARELLLSELRHREDAGARVAPAARAWSLFAHTGAARATQRQKGLNDGRDYFKNEEEEGGLNLA